MLVFIIIFPFILPDQYVLYVLTTIFILSINAMSWNLLASSGQASLGHAAFFGLGAYGSILLANNFSLSPWFTIFLGPLIPAIMGLGVGLLVVRLREWFLAMVTFGFAVIVQTIIANPLSWLTNGWNGLRASSLIVLTPNLRFIVIYFIVLVAMLSVYFIIHKTFNSKFGLAITAIRDNELAANVSGISLIKYKLLVFIVSSYIAGFAGALEVHTISTFISPEIFSPLNSFWPLIFSISGGIGTTFGPILGTFLIRTFWEILREIGGFESMIIIGFILVLIVIFLPKGLLPILKKVINPQRS